MSSGRTKRVTKLEAQRAASGPASHPRPSASGILIGTIEQERGERFVVRLADGEIAEASVAPPCRASLLRECMRDARPVLLTATPIGYGILGAIQTEPAMPRPDDGAPVVLNGRELHLEGQQRVCLRAGRTALELDADGRLRLVGDRLTMDVTALIRLLSSRVELP